MAASKGATTEVEATTKTTKAKTRADVDFFTESATKIEGLTKTKALSEAIKCSRNVEDNSFILGGILKRIHENNWYEDYESFGEYVFETFGFQERKARYLMEIYSELTFNRIPWDKVSVLGWTKIKMLCKILSIDNVDEWVEKAGSMSVKELEAVLKAEKGDVEDKNTSTENNVKTMSFKLHADQIDAVNAGLAKAKADFGTEYDNVALEAMANAYLGATTDVDIPTMLQNLGLEAAMELVEKAFPEAEITVAV